MFLHFSLHIFHYISYLLFLFCYLFYNGSNCNWAISPRGSIKYSDSEYVKNVWKMCSHRGHLYFNISTAYKQWESFDPHICVCRCVFYQPVKCRWEKRCWMKCVSAEKSRSCSLSTLIRTAALMCSRPLRSAQNDSTSPEDQKENRKDFISVSGHFSTLAVCCCG